MNYKTELTRTMTMLAQQERTLFLGQSVVYPGQAMFPTLEGVPLEKRLELPIAEEMQMGMSIGLSLMGFLPISLYARMDFLLLAMNQLVNHLDKVSILSHGEFQPKVIIRTMVGGKRPLDGGPQHTQDFSEALKSFIPHVSVYRLLSAETILPFYERAVIKDSQSCIMVEYEALYYEES